MEALKIQDMTTDALADCAGARPAKRKALAMDPNATLALILSTEEAIKKSSCLIERAELAEGIRQARKDLADWLDRGGFVPDYLEAAMATVAYSSDDVL